MGPAQFFGMPWWINVIWAGVFVAACLGIFLGSDTGLRYRTYLGRWLFGWRRLHSEWVRFSAIQEVKPEDVFSPEMKEKIEECGGYDAVRISSTGYIDWCTGLAHTRYTLWAKPKKRITQ